MSLLPSPFSASTSFVHSSLVKLVRTWTKDTNWNRRHLYLFWVKLTRRTTRDQKIIYLRIYYSSTVKKNNVLCKKTIELFVTNRSRNCFFSLDSCWFNRGASCVPCGCHRMIYLVYCRAESTKTPPKKSETGQWRGWGGEEWEIPSGSRFDIIFASVAQLVLCVRACV